MPLKRGLMIQAPMGTGKSYWIKNHVQKNKKDIFLDGDELLNKLNIKNSNYFWYSGNEKNQHERQKIIDTFENYVSNGYFILYSGNPNIMPTDIIIHIDSNERKKRVLNPHRFNPSDEQFDREEAAYIEAIKNADKNNITVIEDNIPDVDVLEKLRDINIIDEIIFI